MWKKKKCIPESKKSKKVTRNLLKYQKFKK